MKKRLSAMFSMCLMSVLILSSCAIFPFSSQKKAEQKIREAVQAYFDEMEDGTFESNGFKNSDYVHDAPFADLHFEKEAARKIMGQAMTALEYEILDVSCDEDMGKGECEVQLSYVDLESIIEDLGDGMTTAVLGEAVLDGDAPTKKTKIVIDMIIGEPEWIIKDSTEIADLLGEPYTQIVFAPGIDEFSEAIDLLFTSLAAGDTEVVDKLSPDFDSADFFAVSPEDIALWEAFFASVEFEVTGEPRVDGNKAVVDVSLSFPNMTEISLELAKDDDQMLAIMTEFLTYFQQYMENDTELVTSRLLINEAISLAFSSTMLNEDAKAEFTFLVDPESSDLIFTDIPRVLFEYPADRSALENAAWTATEPALKNYYESGAIDLATYTDWYAVFVGVENVPDVSGDELIDDLIGGEWFHYFPDGISGEKVSEYNTDDTYYLSYLVYFNTARTGVNVYFVWLDEEGTQIGVFEGTLQKSAQTGSYAYGDFSLNDSASEKIPPGIYSVLVVASDNLLIMKDEVEVK